MDPDWIIRFYNQRDTVEQHIKEGKRAIYRTRLSCNGMVQKDVWFLLHALAYNHDVLRQGTDFPEAMDDWSLIRLLTRLIKVGAKAVRHARGNTFQLVEMAVRNRLFNRIIAAIYRLCSPPVSALSWR